MNENDIIVVAKCKISHHIGRLLHKTKFYLSITEIQLIVHACDVIFFIEIIVDE